MKTGTVYLIGAGPGDPGLITVKGRSILERADIVVYDRLAHPSLLQYAKPDAELIFVGKSSAHHAMPQGEINRVLVERALSGKSVARLKGGDPFVFGRGGEEAEHCKAHDVPFVVVPGVTSAIAAPAYAGIPVTHRDAASSFAIITGHERDDRGEAGTREAGAAEGRRNWSHIAHAGDTLIFLMGVEALTEITARLCENGRAPSTPVALVQWGTWPAQRVVVGTLETIVAEAKSSGITPPAVCVVGDVVNLRSKLQWWDDRDFWPLFGRRILVTRAREQASGLAESLRAEGADPVVFPTIQITPIPENESLARAVSNVRTYDWLVFTSVNAVGPFSQALADHNLDARALAGCKIAAIGPATADVVRSLLGIVADFVPSSAVAESLVEEWPHKDLSGCRVLLPRAAQARDVIPDGLISMGASVDVIPAYRTVPPETEATELRNLLLARKLDALTFTASSTVHNFVDALHLQAEPELLDAVNSATIAAIGPVTAQSLRDYGLVPSIVAGTHTIPGLVEALKQFFGTNHP